MAFGNSTMFIAFIHFSFLSLAFLYKFSQLCPVPSSADSNDVHSIRSERDVLPHFKSHVLFSFIHFTVCYLDLNLFFSRIITIRLVAFDVHVNNSLQSHSAMAIIGLQNRRVMCLSFPSAQIHCHAAFHFFTIFFRSICPNFESDSRFAVILL